MKMTAIRLNNIAFPLLGLQTTEKYIVKAVDGLGPPEIERHIEQNVNHGSFYGGSTPQLRQIIMRIGLNPDYSIGESPSDLRSNLYQLISLPYDRPVPIEVFDGSVEQVKSSGWVSKFEIVPFSKDPEVQITLDCNSPYWLAPQEVHIDPSSLSKTLPFFPNIGEVPVGFRMEIQLTAANPTSIMINSEHDLYNPDILIIDFTETGVNWLANDRLVIDTRPGMRTIQRVRGSISTAVVSGITLFRGWPDIPKGGREFRLSSSPTPPNWFEWYDFLYVPTYWGV